MAYVNTARAGSPAILEALLHPMGALRVALQRRRVYAQTVNELNSLSDRDLADLGIHRSLIRAVAKEAAYGM